MSENAEQKSEQLQAVKRMQEYIESHLKEPITQNALARAAGYSGYHAARLFREYTGKTPFEYIRLMRLCKSALTLGNEKARVRVIDVAMDYVFDSHEGFTRAFFKEFGVTPKKYSKNPAPLKLFMPPDIREAYIKNSERREESVMCRTPGAIFVQIVERPKRRLILKRAKKATHYFEYCEEVGCEVWDILCGIKEALYEPVGMWMPDNLRPAGTSLYTQGVEVPADWQGELPEGFEIIELPACKVLIFQGPPYDDEKIEEAIDELWQQTKNYNPEIYGYEWFDEAAPKFQLAPMGYRGYIEGRPVREIGGK